MEKNTILVVDDEPISSDLIRELLESKDYLVEVVRNGMECINYCSQQTPKAIFMDIEMPVLDGYETCERLRTDSSTVDIPIIFISAHDSLESKVRAYLVGADDFISKPFLPGELVRKAAVGVRMSNYRENHSGENMHQALNSVLSSLGETGVVLKFTRDSMSCRSLVSLAQLAIDAMASQGMDCHIQIRSKGEVFTMKSGGSATPLETAVIEHSRQQGRIFEFGRRMIINYDAFSMLIMNLPLQDAEKCGRIRDYAAQICEAGEVAVGNIQLRLDAIERAEHLRQIANATQYALANLQGGLHRQRIDTRIELDRMVDTIETMYYSLGLTDNQEAQVSEVVRSAINCVMEIYERGSAYDQDFQEILISLAAAIDQSSTVIEPEETKSEDIEFF